MIAELMDVELRLNEDLVEKITTMFSSRNRPMPENNLRQAMVPVGAEASTRYARDSPWFKGSSSMVRYDLCCSWSSLGDEANGNSLHSPRHKD